MVFKADKPTFIVSGVILAAIILWDVFTLCVRGYDTTISWQMFTLAQDFPIVSFALGVVCGHLFWPNRAAMMPPPAQVLPIKKDGAQ